MWSIIHAAIINAFRACFLRHRHTVPFIASLKCLIADKDCLSYHVKDWSISLKCPAYMFLSETALCSIAGGIGGYLINLSSVLAWSCLWSSKEVCSRRLKWSHLVSMLQLRTFCASWNVNLENALRFPSLLQRIEWFWLHIWNCNCSWWFIS